jgi:hypothetical protein
METPQSMLEEPSRGSKQTQYLIQDREASSETKSTDQPCIHMKLSVCEQRIQRRKGSRLYILSTELRVDERGQLVLLGHKNTLHTYVRAQIRV